MSDLSNTSRTDLHAQQQDLAAKLARAETEIEAIKAEMTARLGGYQRDAQSLRSQLGQISSEIARREATDSMVPTISDHALLRYIERICGVDTEALKAELMTDNLVSAIRAGASGLKSTLGTFVIKGSTVVTFLSADMRPKNRTKRGLRQDDAEDEIEEGAQP